MLDQESRKALHQAILALRQGDGAGWQALAPLSALSALGTDISIDFTTEPLLGAPVIIARPTPKPLEGLTPRQVEVVQALSQGMSNKDIARALKISPATVKDHVQDILAITGLKNRTEIAAAFLLRQTA